MDNLPSDPERAAATFVTNITLDDIPTSVSEEATILVADTIAAVVGGVTATEVKRLAQDQAKKNPGSATIHGTRYTASAGHAALVNGVGGSVLELNAGHKYAAGHPVIQLLPALIAEAEVTDVDGSDFLSAFIASYEVCTRTARACEPLGSEYLPHGVWGAVGAAAGVSRLRGFTAEETLTAMQLAANFAQHTSFESTSEGATGVRNGSCGFSNHSGIIAVDLAETGFTGLKNGIKRHLDRTTAEGFDTAILSDRLGEHWELLRGYYKIHASGRLTHPAIDGADSLQSKHGFDAGDVVRVEVETYQKAAKWLGSVKPKNRLQAKSSIPFSVATRLIHGESGKDAFEPEAITNEVIDFMDRIDVRVDDEIDARVPDARSARVTIHLTDGQTVTEEIRHARGGEERPYELTELRSKFDELVEPVLGADRASDIWELARSLPESDPARLSALGGLNE